MKQKIELLIKSEKRFELTNENIQKIVDNIERFINQLNINKQTKLWLTLSIEKTLLSYQDQKEEGRTVFYFLKKRFGSILDKKIILSLLKISSIMFVLDVLRDPKILIRNKYYGIV